MRLRGLPLLSPGQLCRIYNLFTFISMNSKFMVSKDIASVCPGFLLNYISRERVFSQNKHILTMYSYFDNIAVCIRNTHGIKMLRDG